MRADSDDDDAAVDDADEEAPLLLLRALLKLLLPVDSPVDAQHVQEQQYTQRDTAFTCVRGCDHSSRDHELLSS